MNDAVQIQTYCSACAQAIDRKNKTYPSLCRACAKAAPIAEILNASGLDMSERHYELVVAALADLKNDPNAFESIRRYTALLNTDVAIVLFLDPTHRVCLDLDSV